MGALNGDIFSSLGIGIAFALLGLYLIGKGIYRLYLHPLSKVPGPRLAALTVYYEAYFNVIRGGQFLFQLERLHRRHGPLVRIGPGEVHVADAAFYDSVYTPHGRWDKPAAFVNQFDNTDSAFGTIAHDRHRARRRAFQPYFATHRVVAFEPALRRLVAKLCARIRTYRDHGQVLPLRHALECLTNDVVMEFAFKRSDENLDKEGFNPELHETIKTVGKSGHFMKLIPGVQRILPLIPPWLLVRMVPVMKPMVELQEQCKALAQNIITTSASGSSTTPPPKPLPTTSSAYTVCHEIHQNPDLPAAEKTQRRMQHEIETFAIAGTETTAHALTCIAFHVLDNPPVRNKLKLELREAKVRKQKQQQKQQQQQEKKIGGSRDENAERVGFVEGDDENEGNDEKEGRKRGEGEGGEKNELKWKDLERLPYLTSVILEGLRLSYGVATRLPRIAPDRVVRYQDFDIPPGTSISMSSYLIHHNPEIFPDPLKFEPERWMGREKRGGLEKYLMNFSRGTRACVGIGLAYAELYITTAALFSTFDFQLVDTTRDDVTLFRENFTPQAKVESQGVRVLVL